MGLLLTEGETRANYSRCAATMVGEIIFRFTFSSQIGSNVFLTVAHCLQNWAGVVQAPSQLKIILGVQNRRKLTSKAKLYLVDIMQIYATTNVCHFTVPREFHITEVVLHENFNFTRQVNDIAVLKTSKFLVAPNISTSINN